MGAHKSSDGSSLASGFCPTLARIFVWGWSAGGSFGLLSSNSFLSAIFSSGCPVVTPEPSATKDLVRNDSLPVFCLHAKPLILLLLQWEYCLLKISLRSCEDPLCDKQLVPIEFTPYASRSLFIEMDAADTFLISCLISSRPSGFRDVPSLINRWKMRR